MHIVIAAPRLSAVADGTSDRPLSHVIAHIQAFSVSLEMRVIKRQLLIFAHLINYIAAESVAADPDDFAVGGRQHRGSAWRHNIYCAMDPATGTRGFERVEK